MVGEQQRELVSSEAERLSALTEPRRDLREHAVPRRVSEAVVDPLEVVDVHQAERQRACLLFGVQQLALQSLVEVAVVAEAGEGIREREPHRAERAVSRALVEGDCEQRSDERDREHRRALPEHDQHQRCRGHERERDDRRAHVCLHQVQVRLVGAECDRGRDQHDVHDVVGGGGDHDASDHRADALALDRRDQSARRKCDEREHGDVEGDALQRAVLGELDDGGRGEQEERPGRPPEEHDRGDCEDERERGDAARRSRR